MYDNLKQKINITSDTVIADTRTAAVHDDAWTSPHGMVKSAGVETRPLSASTKTGARTSVSDSIIAEEQAATN